MKYTALLFLLFIGTSLFAQHIGDDDGKVYYDDEKTKLKEVYNYKEKLVFAQGDPSKGMEKQIIKHGPYFFYYESGQLKLSGTYKDGEKHNLWKHYNEKGTLTKVEKYRKGELLNTDTSPNPDNY